MNQPTPFRDLNVLLEALVDGAKQVLQEKFSAAWLQGSFAVGDFDEHSDVDFIFAIKEELSRAEISALERMHRRIYDLEISWAKHLEGSYFPLRILRSYRRSGENIWYLDRGSVQFERSDHDNRVVIRWILREKGVTLEGVKPYALIDEIPTEALQQEIFKTMTDWGEKILADPGEINNRFYQGFAVLSYSRMLHDLIEGSVGSKRTGAEWAKANLDPSWRGLIDRAWEGRPNPAISVKQPADKADLKSTLDYISEILEMAHTFARENLLNVGGKHESSSGER